MSVLVSPSILSADFANLAEECRSLEAGGADWIHCDVMDGVFVPNITFGMPVLRSLRGGCALPFDVHLMIDRPERYVRQFAELGSDIITFHVEATDRVEETAKIIRQCGKKVGLSVKPATPVEALEKYRNLLDLVLVMSVEPGFGGQSFMPQSLEKIRTARKLFPNAIIEVDGGVNAENVGAVTAAGATVVVAGSAVFKAQDRAAAIKALRG